MDDRHRKRIETLINQTIKREMQELGERISDHTRASLVLEQKEKREAADRGQPVDWSAYAFWNNSRVYMLRASWMREAAEAFIKATGDEIYATSSGADAGAMFRDGAARMLSELDGMVTNYRKQTAAFGPSQANKLEHFWNQERQDAVAAEEIAFLRFDDHSEETTAQHADDGFDKVGEETCFKRTGMDGRPTARDAVLIILAEMVEANEILSDITANAEELAKRYANDLRFPRQSGWPAMSAKTIRTAEPTRLAILKAINKQHPKKQLG